MFQSHLVTKLCRLFSRQSRLRARNQRVFLSPIGVEGLEDRTLLSNMVSGTVYIDSNASGTRDVEAINPVSGVELGSRGPVILQPGDDGSSTSLSLGFNFDFYGNSYSQVFINNNGNLTFTSSLSEYKPVGFPQQIPIIAPFWADVDTRGDHGTVHQSTGISPRGHAYFQVDWVDVGYFNTQGDLRNSFSVYLEDDPAGDLVAFFYGDMQWTTTLPGGATGNDGAQIGFDSGNGTNFLSYRRPVTAEDLRLLSNTQTVFRIGSVGVPGDGQLEAGAVSAVVYIDTNGNAVRDPGEPFTTTSADLPGTTNVNEAGRFEFNNLSAGTYTIRQELPSGFQATSPSSGSWVVNFPGNSGTAQGQDFGRRPVATLSGRVFEDLNRNGLSDASDRPAANVTVYLDTNNNGVRDTGELFTVSSATGTYEFRGVLAGQEFVRAVASDGRFPIVPSGGKISVFLAPGETRTGLDFGFTLNAPPRVVAVNPSPSANVGNGVSTISLQFDKDIDPAAYWGGLFELLAAGGDGRFDNGNEQPIPLTFVDWNSVNHTLRVTAGGLLPRDTYRLTATDGLIDATGNRLDGDFRGAFPSGDGVAGGAFVTEFVVTNTPPLADPYFGQTSQAALAVHLTANDTDGVVTGMRIVSAPLHGTLVASGGLGNYTYQPVPGFVGVDTFRFVATDGVAEGPEVEGQIVVALTAVDFVLTDVTVEPVNTLAVGLPATISWTVNNIGLGTTVAYNGADWYDEIYLSLNDRIDAGDVRLDRVGIDSLPIASGGTYSRTQTVTLPFSELSGSAFILVRTNSNFGQLETNANNNVFVTPITLQPAIELLIQTDSFMGRNQAFPVTWRDAAQGDASVTIAIDTDADPANGVGQIILATGLPETPDGAADRANVTLPANLPSGSYYLWARVDAPNGSGYSIPVPVRVFEEAYQGEDSGKPAVGGGAYEVFGVDLAREGDIFTYRVRTNYNPLASGGDVYINVGGSFVTGGGRLSGIAVRDKKTATGQVTVAGQLYTGATFLGGSIHHERPIYVQSYQAAVSGVATANVSTTTGRKWKYEINGQVSRAAIGAGEDDSVEIGWGMYCGNDFSDTDNDKDRLNLLGAGFVIKSPSEGNPSTESRRWGDSVNIDFYVTNQGNADVGATTVRFVASSDIKIELNDVPLSVESGQVNIPPIAVGQSYHGQVTVKLPADAPSGFDQVGTIYLGMISDSGNAVEESDEADNFNFGFGFDKDDLRIGRPHFVDILIHGYDPPLPGRLGVGDYQVMWNTWKGFGQRILDFANSSGNPQLENNVDVFVTQWQSSDGWHSAFIDVLASIAMETVIQRLPASPLTLLARGLQAMFLTDARNSMNRAAALAYQAADGTVADVLSANNPDGVSLLGLPSEGQRIHVIGHSRGGAVGAEVVRQLRSMGYDVAEYTALDGYSVDWPVPSDILSDIDIVGTVAAGGADVQINYRVQEGLAVVGASGVKSFLDNYLSGQLQRDIHTVLDEKFLALVANWRAPDRVGFVNPVFPGEGAPSNHINISEQYFDLTTPRRQYNPYDDLLDAAGGGGFAAQAAVANGPIQTNASTTVNRVLNTFADGGFEDAGSVLRTLAEIGEIPSFNDPLVDTLLELLGLPGFGVDTSLDVTGDYQLIDDGGNYELQLGQTNNTRFASLVRLDPTAEKLGFRYSATAAGPGDELVVTFEGEEVARYNLASVVGSGFHTVSVDVSQFAGRFGDFQFQLVGPTSVPSVIRLDDLIIENAPVAPVIGAIADRHAFENDGTLTVLLPISDEDTPLADLSVNVAWDNKTLVANNAASVSFVNGHWQLNLQLTADTQGTALFTVSVQDATSAVVQSSFRLTVTENVAPVITTSPGEVFVRGGLQIRVDSVISLSDPDSNDFNGGKVEVSIHSGGDFKDRLGIRKSNFEGVSTVLSKSILKLNGREVAVVTGGLSKSIPLLIQFFASVTQTEVSQVLRSVTLKGSKKTLGPRSIWFTATDPTHLVGTPAIKTITVTKKSR